MRPQRSPNSSILKYVASLPLAQRETLIRETARQADLDPEELKARLILDWQFIGRPKQQEPEGHWTFWVVLAGRGFGKTVTGAQWVKKQSQRFPGCRIGLVAPTQSDVRATMVEGESGLLNVLPNEMLLGQTREIAWKTTKLELHLANNTLIQGYSAERPDRLRGPQHHFKWHDEASSYKDASQGDKLGSTWSNAKLSTRLGDSPRHLVTTTPKPNKLTKEMLAIPGVRLVTGSSYENRDNLSEEWWAEVVAPLEGTRTALQEIHAQYLDDVEGALWSREILDNCRIPPGSEPAMRRVVVAIDPQGSTDEAANEAGIIVCGKGINGHGYVLDDRTPTEKGPWAWGQAAVEAYEDWKADRVVAETNFGAAMVEFVIKTQDPTVAFKAVTASRGKRVRAEPVAVLYQGDNPRVHHVGVFEELENEQVMWTPDPGADSPNRLDALVWGMTELGIWQPQGRARTSVPKGRLPGVSGELPQPILDIR